MCGVVVLNDVYNRIKLNPGHNTSSIYERQVQNNFEAYWYVLNVRFDKLMWSGAIEKGGGENIIKSYPPRESKSRQCNSSGMTDIYHNQKSGGKISEAK